LPRHATAMATLSILNAASILVAVSTQKV
ncbi:AAA domain protein, partial [Vibrio parahaemolyticus V-223/04]